MSYEAVVLAAGLGNGVMCLLGNTCKALLPLANMPLVYYPIRLLRAHGISRITLIVLETYKSDVKDTVDRLFPDAAAAGVFDYVELREEDALGTMDALRRYKDRARSDNIIVISGDLVSDPDLLRLATDIHDKRLCSATLLLSNRSPVGEAQATQGQGQQPQAATPGGKVKAKPDRDLIGLVRPPLNGPRPPASSAELAECGYVQGEHRLVYMQSEEDLGKRVAVPLGAMRQLGHSVDFMRCLLDAHLYVLRRDLLRWLCDQRPKLSMLKGECMPLVINELQHCCVKREEQPLPVNKGMLSWQAVLAQSDVASVAVEARMEAAAAAAADASESGGAAVASAGVYGYILPANRLCLRVNRLPAYAEATRLLLRLQQHQSQQAPLGDGAVVKRSFLGTNCRIGAGSRLVDCVLMDGAVVGDNCSLTNCVLCIRADCQSGCTLKDCIVEADCVVAAGTSAAAEIISEADFAA